MNQLLAQINNPALNRDFESGEEFLQSFLPTLIGIIFVIGVLAFFFIFLFGAIQWITSGGDKVKVEAARSKITHAIIGLFILFSVFAVAGLLGSFLGVNLLQINIEGLGIE